ncbi:ParB/RepB/Spo0J family partition protein [candidate division WOR-3 bacterium]|nr:ParB/RepB/Spo0J family partition protein [candidate division WOR-3 bacterium]
MGRKALGKGLQALIPEAEEEGTVKISINRIYHSPFQPRSKIDNETIKELTLSIKEKGILQPLLVRKVGEKYELVYGHRRFEAAKKAGLTEIPVVIRELSDREVLEISIIENVQREDLNPLDEAKAYQKLAKEFGLTQEEIAKRVGKERSTITNKLRLLKLPKQIQDALGRGKITEGHARAILALKSEKKMLEELEKILKEKSPVRTVEKRVKEKPYRLRHIESELMNIFHTKVSIAKSKKKGKIEIVFYSEEDLERILNLLRRIEDERDS